MKYSTEFDGSDPMGQFSCAHKVGKPGRISTLATPQNHLGPVKQCPGQFNQRLWTQALVAFKSSPGDSIVQPGVGATGPKEQIESKVYMQMSGLSNNSIFQNRFLAWNPEWRTKGSSSHLSAGFAQLSFFIVSLYNLS